MKTLTKQERKLAVGLLKRLQGVLDQKDTEDTRKQIKALRMALQRLISISENSTDTKQLSIRYQGDTIYIT